MNDDPYRAPRPPEHQSTRHLRPRPWQIALLIVLGANLAVWLMGGSIVYGVLICLGTILVHFIGQLAGTPRD